VNVWTWAWVGCGTRPIRISSGTNASRSPASTRRDQFDVVAPVTVHHVVVLP
jgi:hypothetical protein